MKFIVKIEGDEYLYPWTVDTGIFSNFSLLWDRHFTAINQFMMIMKLY